MRKNKYSKILIHTSTNIDLEIWPFNMFVFIICDVENLAPLKFNVI